MWIGRYCTVAEGKVQLRSKPFPIGALVVISELSLGFGQRIFGWSFLLGFLDPGYDELVDEVSKSWHKNYSP
jgi:hypothetical protein